MDQKMKGESVKRAIIVAQAGLTPMANQVCSHFLPDFCLNPSQ
jgi:hypothetical protein